MAPLLPGVTRTAPTVAWGYSLVDVERLWSVFRGHVLFNIAAFFDQHFDRVADRWPCVGLDIDRTGISRVSGLSDTDIQACCLVADRYRCDGLVEHGLAYGADNEASGVGHVFH